MTSHNVTNENELTYAGASITVEVGRDTIDPQGLGSDEDAEACAYCGAEHAPSSSVPALDDDAAWDELADDHESHCEWVLTRAHRLDTVVKVDQEYGPDAWWRRARATVDTQTPAVSALFARIEEREEAYCRAQDAEALVQWAETLPAWHDGPEYAPNPLIVRSVKD